MCSKYCLRILLLEQVKTIFDKKRKSVILLGEQNELIQVENKMFKRIIGTGLLMTTLLSQSTYSNAEELKASGVISASCAFLSNQPGVLVANAELTELGTIYGNQPKSINYTIAVSGGATLDYSEAPALSFNGADITPEVVFVESVRYRNSQGIEIDMGSPEGLISLTTSVYDFSHNVAVKKADATELQPGLYEYSKVVTCTGGIVEELPVEEPAPEIL